MAEIQANALGRYLIVITSDIFLAKKVIKIRHSPTATAVRKKNENLHACSVDSATPSCQPLPPPLPP